jgi:hypothetical protein
MAQLSETRVLASPGAAGVHDARIVARDFDDWLQGREKVNA